jgi:hypothetical protein
LAANVSEPTNTRVIVWDVQRAYNRAVPSRVHLALIPLLLSVGASGCKESAPPCMSMGMPSELVQRARLLRLDVYDSGVRCDGITVTAGSPPPSQTKVVAAGQPITLDIPAGLHAMVLTAFGDDAGTQAIGAACTESDLKADSARCFMLALSPVPDLAEPVDLSAPTCDGGPCACTQTPDSCPIGSYCGVDGNCAGGCKATADCVALGGVTRLCDVPTHRCVECLGPSDCAPGKRCSPSGACVDGCDVPAGSLCPGALACCSNLCIDTDDELSSCGACGRACNSASVSTPQCKNGLCTSACVAGRGNCNKPIAPAADDGCETDLNDVTHCASCTTVCNLPNATPACPAGSCTVQSCGANFFNCNGLNPDGCECPGVDLADGMMGCCAGGTCQPLHANGLGQTFRDCTALGTYTEALARRAATAFPLANADPLGPFKMTCGASEVIFKRNAMMNECAGWGFTGALLGKVKHVMTNCMCPTGGDLPWQ